MLFDPLPQGSENMETNFFKKTHFFKKVTFFIFLFSQSQVYGYPCDPLAIVVAWVPIMGVYNQFLGASGPIKKKRQNFAIFKFSFFAKNTPKCAKKIFLRFWSIIIFKNLS